MEAGPLPPRPQHRRGRLQPSASTEQSWQHLVNHPRNCELAIIGLALLCLPWTVIAGLHYGWTAWGCLSLGLTILSSVIAIYAYLKSTLSCVTSLIRCVIFLVGWGISSIAAQTTYVVNRFPDTDAIDYQDPASFTTPWYIIVRSLFYWVMCVTFFIYMIISAVAVHRHRHKSAYERYRMQAPAQYNHGYGVAGPPPPAGYPPATGSTYMPPPGPPPPGPAPPQYQYK